jgi:RNA polymerase sigma-70 factor (ECF subfamily)
MAESMVLDNLFRKIAFEDDREAFRELFFDFYPSLCVFAQRYIASPETCEDIVQDTFFHLWKNRKKIEITASFRNLLITSVKNSCVDYLRKQSVRQVHSEKQVAEAISESYSVDTPEGVYTIRELEAMLHTALGQMPGNVRRAFELSRFENMTYNQIAEEMSISLKTVESYISKALTILRIELKDYLPLVLFACSAACL